MLTDKTIQAIFKLQKKYPEKRSALIPALHLAQAEKGYLPLEAQEDVARLFGLETNEVHAVVTFYDMFYEKPMGKHLIHVCKNLSCMLRGSDELIETLCAKLKTAPGDVSPDGEFTIIPSECLGACDLAPMMIVDDQVVGPVDENQLDQILSEARKQAGRCCSVVSEVDHG